MKKVRKESEYRGFLAAMLSGTARKDAPHLADEGPFCPEAACPIEELPHLPAHIAEARGCPEDDGIRSGEFIHRADRDVCKTLLRLEGAHLSQDFFREGFRDTIHGNIGPLDHPCAFRNGLRHAVDMAIHGIVNDEDLHDMLPFSRVDLCRFKVLNLSLILAAQRLN
jgi:hypothetical protein